MIGIKQRLIGERGENPVSGWVKIEPENDGERGKQQQVSESLFPKANQDRGAVVFGSTSLWLLECEVLSVHRYGHDVASAGVMLGESCFGEPIGGAPERPGIFDEGGERS